jgi:NADH:ubiquinone oxidoreductase subunit E
MSAAQEASMTIPKDTQTKKGWDKADLKGNIAEALTFTQQVSGLGVAEFRAARPVWESMSTLTHTADEAMKRAKPDADKKAIVTYLKAVREKMKTVPSK